MNLEKKPIIKNWYQWNRPTNSAWKNGIIASSSEWITTIGNGRYVILKQERDLIW